MANDVSIPLASEALVDDNKAPSASWYRVLTAWAASYNGSTQTASDLADTVAALDTRIDGNDTDIAALDTRVVTLEGASAKVVPLLAGDATGGTLDIAVSSAYDMYEIDLINIQPATDNTFLWMRFSQAGYLAGASDYSWGRMDAATLTADEADNQFIMTAAIGNNTSEHYTGTVRVFRPGVASFDKSANWRGVGRTGTPASYSNDGGGTLLANTNAIDGVRFMFSAGNIASGYYAVRGYKFS